MNSFLHNPVKVVVFDPIRDVNKHTFVFLGDVPKAIWNACNYYRAVTAGQRTAYDKLLREWYGSDFKTKLGLDIRDFNRAWIYPPEQIGIIGGSERGKYTEAGHFTHNNARYDIACALERASDLVTDVPVSKLAWILNEVPVGYFDDEYEQFRVNQADISAPLLLTNDDTYGVVTLDGTHRLKKAVGMGVQTLPARFISAEDLAKCIEPRTDDTKYIAGNDVDDEEFDTSDIEELLKSAPAANTAARAAKVITSSVTSDELRAEFVPGIEYITDICVYPEDKFSELKDKLYLASNIPAYRQHMFYIDGNRLSAVYQIYAEGYYNIDIRTLPQYTDNIYGVPIDKALYDIRDSIRVEALDMFKILSETLPSDNVVYIVDLAQFTARLQTQLLEVIGDTYQFELFYYGFVIKYWPQLTPECFYDYVRSEPEMQHKYPDLARSKLTINSICRAEKEIINCQYKSMNRALSYAQSAIMIAITQMTAMVSPTRGVMLNIRNLFDKLRVTRCIPEIHAYTEYNNKRYMLRKRHIKNGSDIQFPSGTLMKTGITIAISLRKSDQESFHAKSTVSTTDNEQSRYLFLNIWPNGRYYIKTIWNEEDELSFEDIIRIMKKFTDPIINGVNSLGKYVFIAGASLPLINKQNIDYQGLNICVFWKKVMLESTFKVVRGLWEAYIRARITGPRNVQQFDKYEFLFRKGMHEFDTTAIDRIITASNNIVLTNHYAHLSNNTVKQKWDQNYDGRIVRMSHRTTDIRFEVSDIREHEFVIFHNYVIAFVYRAINHERVKAALTATKSYKDVKKLRKLREQDPELFNLKKYGSKKVYSIICQNQRQPLIYTPDELKNMPAAEIKKLTQYWNFTLNKPAYYGCPNRKYPHLSFMVNAHPRHYCLPCCNKKPQTGLESKKTRINTVCLQRHKFMSDDNITDAGISRHIMNYGKDIDLARLSKSPPPIKNLLFNTLANLSQNYYLYGVAQHLPGAENTGLIYAVAASLDISLPDLMNRLVGELRRPEMSNLFSTLLYGTLYEYFRDMSDLTDVMKDLFLDRKLYSHEIQRFKQWPELFVELMHILFRVSVFTFIDEVGDGLAIDLFVPDILRNEILYVSKLSGELSTTLMSGQSYLLIVKKVNHYYPVFVVDTERYFKTFEVAMRHYVYDDKVVQLLYNMVKYESRSEELQVDKMIDLSLIKAFSMYQIRLKFINRQNLCYAVMLSATNKNKKGDISGDSTGYIYVPIDYSVHVSDNIAISFEAFSRADYDLDYVDLAKFVADLNNFIQTGYAVGGSPGLHSYRLIRPVDYFGINLPAMNALTTVTTNNICGFTSADCLMFYFNKYNPADLDSALPIRSLAYDYTEVNQAIIARSPPVADNRTTKIGEALYNNYLYQLFVIEFVSYLNSERNEGMRNRLKQLIRETNFKKDVGGFRKAVRTLLKEYPTDYSLVQNQLIAFYRTYFDKAYMLEQIDAASYEFDRVTMNKLKKLSREDLRKELKIIAEGFSVQRDFDTTQIRFPNIYMPCGEMKDETGYCVGSKLIINRPIDDFVDILATDLMDDLKSKYLLNNAWMDILVDFFSFARWPTEIVTIYKLVE